MLTIRAGQRHFGENYIQELATKAASMPLDINWHFIGTLQSNKCKVIAQIPNLFLVETVASVKTAIALDKACAAAGRSEPLGILLQINTSNEDSKGGLRDSDCVSAAREVMQSCQHLKLRGLMTIGSPENSAISPNPDFAALVHCKSEVERACGISGLELSMGMSHDYENAIMQGSTNVRVGSRIFGAR